MTGFEWKMFVDVADTLCQSDEESFIRCAISRYYYAAFGTSRHYLTETMKELHFLKGEKIHSRVLKRFEDSLFEEEETIYQPLSRLKNFRISADYDKKLRKHNIELIKKEALFVLKKLQSLCDNPIYEQDNE